MFKLPDLPYAYEALEPTISANTLHFHHDKHHAAYVNALNGLLPEGDKRPLEGQIAELDRLTLELGKKHSVDSAKLEQCVKTQNQDAVKASVQEAEGLGDAPWPPHYKKQGGEPPRVAPSKRRKAPGAVESPTGRRRSTQPLVTVAKARHEAEARAGLERWKSRHPAAAARLETDDVLVDAMRGRSSTWTRIRVNLRHVPEADRPEPEPPDPDYDPWRGFREGAPREGAPRERAAREGASGTASDGAEGDAPKTRSSS